MPVELLCQYIDKLILKKASGTFNVGSGIPILVSDYIRRTINLKAFKLIIKLKKILLIEIFALISQSL